MPLAPHPARTPANMRVGASSACASPRAMRDRPGYLLVVPWPVLEESGVNQVILGLYREFDCGGVLAPSIGVMSWAHKRPATVSEGGRIVTYLRVRAPFAAKGSTTAWILAWTCKLVPELLRLAHFLRSNRIEYVNFHYPSLAAFQFVLAGRLCMRKPKMILSFHGLDIANATRAAGLERRLWSALLRRADAIVSCSAAQSAAVLNFAPYATNRAVVVHNGIDAGEALRARNPRARVDARLQGHRFVLSVASYHPKKGLDTLLRAFHIVRDRGVDAMLALVGPDLGSGEELARLAVRLGVGKYVVFCGEVAHRDLHAYYGAADAFCLPSRKEPFGVVLLEAGLFRCPVVASSVGGIPEILEHDVSACLVPADDPDALAAQLERLLGDPGLRRSLADALYERVTTRFTARSAYHAYLDVVARIDRPPGFVSADESSARQETSREREQSPLGAVTTAGERP